MRTAEEILKAAGNKTTPPAAILGPYVRADGLTLLVGPEGSGKSSLLSSVAIAVATGRRPEWAKSVQKGTVLWFTGEEHELIVAKGVETGGEEAKKNIMIESVSSPDAASVLSALKKYKPALVIADPVDVLAPPGCSPRLTLEPLFARIRLSGVGVVAVVHTLHGARIGSKLVKGSGDWTRVARSVVYYGPDPRVDPLDASQSAVLYHLKFNRGGERGEAHSFSTTGAWQGSIPGLDIQELLCKPEKRPKAARPLARAIDLLLRLLANGPVLVSDVLAAADQEGISRATMYRAAEAIGVVMSERSRSSSGRYAGTYWSAADEQDEEDDEDEDEDEEDDLDDDEADDEEFDDSATSQERADDLRLGGFVDPAELRDLSPDEERARLVEAFGLSACATSVEITRRWRELMKEHHPDCGGDDLIAARINAIYHRIRELDELLTPSAV